MPSKQYAVDKHSLKGSQVHLHAVWVLPKASPHYFFHHSSLYPQTQRKMLIQLPSKTKRGRLTLGGEDTLLPVGTWEL